MIHYPYLKEQRSTRQVVDKFKGYNCNLRIGSGEFSQMENLTSDDYPVLSVRKRRGLVVALRESGYATGMLYAPDTGLLFTANHQKDHAEGEMGALYLLDTQGQLRIIVSNLAPGDKSLALMGKYLIIAPDMVAVNIDTWNYQTIMHTFVVDNAMVYFQMCREDGTFYSPLTTSNVAPNNPSDGDYWLEIHGEDKRLRQYSATEESWGIISNTYTKIWGKGMNGHGFQVKDVVELTGFSAISGNYTVCCADPTSIVIDATYMGSGAISCDQDNQLILTRGVPTVDFLVECGNRLWGCKADTNEIYACKLGDFRNWNCFQGLSTDSWVGNVGTAGVFTGAAVQNNYPVFYKENCKHKVWPSAGGAHQITTMTMPGVQKDCRNSIAVLEGAVFYKAPSGVFMDDGGGAVEIGQALGSHDYRQVTGAIHEGKYYLSVRSPEDQFHLFVYDIDRRMWHREERMYGALASGGGSLYAVDIGEIWDLTGNTGTPEEEVSWMAVTGDLGLELSEQKYITRLTLRLSLDPGATLEVYAQYDREEAWVKLGQVYGTDLRSFSLPVRPRRCDQLRLKLRGKGMCKLYSITKTLGKGSEL